MIRFTEIWVDVIDYEDKYSISSTGKVWSKYLDREMKAYQINSGYEAIKLGGKAFLIHRLVAYHFCEGYSEGLVVNHIDNNKLNNRSENLEWCTTKENIHHMMRQGRMNYTEAHKKARIARRISIVAIDIETEEIVEKFESIEDAKEWTGGNPNLNRAIYEGGTSYGYYWKIA